MDFESEEDMQKALELNGKKFMGQELKLDKARSKENSQEGKKGAIFNIDVHCAHVKPTYFQDVVFGSLVRF